MAATNSIRIVREIPWRGGTQLWSNRYHFTGGTPADQAAWDALAAELLARERPIFPSLVTFKNWAGYVSTSSVAAASGAWADLPGQLPVFDVAQASEVVALARWRTAARTSKNHPIYLFSFWHGVCTGGSGHIDWLAPNQRTAMQAYVNAWAAGIAVGGATYKRSGPNGEDALDGTVEQYLTHRDFR